MNRAPPGGHGALAAALLSMACGAHRALAAAAAADAVEDIRDIRGPKYIPPWWAVPALIAAALAVALLLYGAWRWLRRRRRPRALGPAEIALQRLEEIRPLMRPATVREFSTAASDIVRGYIERRFDITATHLTTEEFLHGLLQPTKASLTLHRERLSEFLHQCDLVKFAGISLTVQNMESLHLSARDFVMETAEADPVVAAQAA
jgi:hypothetical protein